MVSLLLLCHRVCLDGCRYGERGGLAVAHNSLYVFAMLRLCCYVELLC